MMQKSSDDLTACEGTQMTELKEEGGKTTGGEERQSVCVCVSHLTVVDTWRLRHSISQTKIRHHNFENILNLQGKERQTIKEKE